MEIMKEVKRLHELGLALHWLNVKSKIPVEQGWTEGERKTLKRLRETFRPGFNLGLRLGKANDLKGKSLGIVDCDVKSKEPEHLKEMEDFLKGLGLRETVSVKSGRGNGSKHIYFVSESEIKPRRLSQSKEKVKVKMPSVVPTRHEKEILSESEIDNGYRLRAAWEVSIMGEGQQVVLPPSVHPDSGKAYFWSRPLISGVSLAKWTPPEVKEKVKAEVDLDGFKPEPVDLVTSSLSDSVVDQIINGEGVEDRSAALFGVTVAMVRAGLTDNQILSVLTDKENFLGQAAYDHRQTSSRAKAAQWVARYTLEKARSEASSKSDFDGAVVVSPDFDELEDDDGWKAGIERNQQTGRPFGTLKNVLNIIKGIMGDEIFLGFNQFIQDNVWLRETPWKSEVGSHVKDKDLSRIKKYLTFHFRLEPETSKIYEALVLIGDECKFHPVREYLNELEWDGTPRLDTWLKDYLGAKGDEKYLKAIGRKTLAAMVKRVYEPGCKFDHVLILEGEQGIGKSTTARILSDPWFSDSLTNIGDKDAVVNMQGVWVYELGELSAMSRYDVNLLKEFITRQSDKIRPPYGRCSEIYPRQCIFIGTTNNDEYLKDQTGNRRFWPVKIGRLKRKNLSRDREQLLAEAVSAYRAGEQLWLDSTEVEEIARKEQNRRMETDAIDEMLSDFLEKEHTDFDPASFRVSDLLSTFDGQGLRNDRQTQMRISAALKRLGYEKDKKMVNGILANWWGKKGGEIDLGF